jgi:hypothetical protein
MAWRQRRRSPYPTIRYVNLNHYYMLWIKVDGYCINMPLQLTDRRRKHGSIGRLTPTKIVTSNAPSKTVTPIVTRTTANQTGVHIIIQPLPSGLYRLRTLRDGRVRLFFEISFFARVLISPYLARYGRSYSR